jgi:bacterial/archaeal transporter family protein
MATWFWYAIAAAVLYGLHQVFTKLAAAYISDGLGGLVVEASATVTIVIYLVFLWLNNTWTQKATAIGIWYSILTGVCVGAGTVMFFLLFQKGGPLSAVPMVLAGGAALMAICGILFFKESASWPRLLGIAFSIAGLLLLRYSVEK